ncbi:50S ribosomal protein L10 [Candidatus Uhrbacteria bacterium RIFCSPLOWO2_02_FULL_54_37]|uniref:Large ribosomal subunit protein uL10 n=1 Tax=Candidatus Uhrbacteria bacterium RIFCSPLOWO2_02_FULL_54_37 TaxID=1802412 RepID=A0A1F7VK38_9BACT|nr:MAG: 50S ribosomal protein L10 [Candidatus Uhrbacteria bacterium RIFCSPLOWO2_02_FULL_54_37]
MPKSKVQKQEEVAAIVSHLKEMQSAAVATSAQVKVKDERSLRAELKKIGARMTVVKKTLLQRALKEFNLADDAIASLKGTLVLAVGKTDAVAPLKALMKFAKGKEKFIVHAGFLNEHGMVRALNGEEVKALSMIASREELLARLVGSLASPLAGMVNVLAGNLRGLVQVLSAYQKAKS